MKESKRERAALTAEVEKRALTWLAHRMPAGVNSDHLTLLGTLAAIAAGAGYALSGLSAHWLWLASVALVVNWFGDSLDGTLARVRRAERPRYGYYIDHAVDAFTTVLIGAGIGLSPYIALPVALLLVILYLVMSINVYLESTVYGVFRMDYGVVGPTEARILLIVANTLLIALGAWGGLRPERVEPVASLGAAVLVGAMTLLLLWRFASNLRTLGRAEPLRAPGTEAPPRGDGTA